MSGTRIVLVTGASSGIGAACARELAGSGWTVFGGCRNPGRPGTAIPGVTMLALDVTAEASVAAAVQYVLAGSGRADAGGATASASVTAGEALPGSGRIDALVCCAGMGVSGSVEDISMAEITLQMDTNFTGVVRCVKAILPAMRQARSGRILIVGSMAGRTGMPFQAFYSASKYALEGFVESLRYEVSQFGIQVGIVEPGDYRTGFTESRHWDGITKAGPYGPAYEAAMGVQIRDEQGGHDPARAGKALARLLGAGRLPVRVTLGPLFERFAIGLKRIIPASIFERFYRIYYKLP